MAADHVCYEEDFNVRYKVPALITNTSIRVIWFWFCIPTILISFYLGDMVKLFNPVDISYLKRPMSDGEFTTRYESMYMHDKQTRF